MGYFGSNYWTGDYWATDYWRGVTPPVPPVVSVIGGGYRARRTRPSLVPPFAWERILRYLADRERAERERIAHIQRDDEEWLTLL